MGSIPAYVDNIIDLHSFRSKALSLLILKILLACVRFQYSPRPDVSLSQCESLEFFTLKRSVPRENAWRVSTRPNSGQFKGIRLPVVID
jgi:hypothetical protein